MTRTRLRAACSTPPRSAGHRYDVTDVISDPLPHSHASYLPVDAVGCALALVCRLQEKKRLREIKERKWRPRDKPPLNEREPKVQVDQPPFLDDEEEEYLLYVPSLVHA